MRITVWIILIGVMTFLGSGCKEEYIHVGKNWDAIYRLNPPEKTFKVKVTSKEKVKLGDALSFGVTSEKDGKLWIVQVDSEDTVDILFPNEKMPDNRIEASKELTIPPKGVSWRIEASEPTGKSILAFVVTTGNADIRDVLLQAKNLSKALILVSEAGEWGIAKKVIETK